MDENNNFNNQEPEINNDQPVADPVFSEPVYYDPEDVNHTENSTNNYNTDYNNNSEGKGRYTGVCHCIVSTWNYIYCIILCKY